MALFQPYGRIKDLRMLTNDTGKFKGAAFMEFESELAAKAAHALNDYELQGRHIAVTTADPNRPEPKHLVYC
jgi:RNA recognition motif-containing protein